MNDIELSQAQRPAARQAQQVLRRDLFDLELEQFDAEFFRRLYRQRAGAAVLQRRYRRGHPHHQAWSERIQEEMDFEKVY